MKSPLALFKLEKKKNQVMKKILCLLSNKKKKKLHQIENNFTRS